MSTSLQLNGRAWLNIYARESLYETIGHYQNIARSPFRTQYLQTILRHCPRGSAALETGIGSGLDSIWLSKRGVQAHGMDLQPELVERARQINNALQGSATFTTGDLFHLDAVSPDIHFAVVHSQGVLEHFPLPMLQQALAGMVRAADYVIFSIPSVYYPYDPEFGDEILWPLAALKQALSPFAIEELRYFGDPQHGEKEHILGILKGDPNFQLNSDAGKLTPGITAIVLAHNEHDRLPDCLKSLQFCDELLVVDMESTDDTATIAAECGAKVIFHENIPTIDRARNIAAQFATRDHILVVDSDERIPPQLAEELLTLVSQASTDPNSADFAGMLLPFQHKFGGHWMRMLWPGYTAPRLLKTGRFRFNNRLHGGVVLDGPSLMFPATDPERAIVHENYQNIVHYSSKQSRYTDGEALSMFNAGQEFSAAQMIAHSFQDLVSYYDNSPQSAAEDGPFRLIYSLLSAHYRVLQHAKLFEMRFNAGLIKPHEWQIPADVNQILNIAVNSVAPVQSAPRPDPIVVQNQPEAANLVYTAPLEDPSGIGEDARSLRASALAVCTPLAVQCLPWSSDLSLFTEAELKQYLEDKQRPAAPGFVHLVQDLRFHQRHPEAGLTAMRHMFETDRLPRGWVQQLNQLDRVLVPGEFNRQTYIDAGVSEAILRVVPGAVNIEQYMQPAPPTEHIQNLFLPGCFTFLTCHEWSLRKNWKATLKSFALAFPGRKDVRLILKVWPASVGYTSEQIQEQASRYLHEECGIDLDTDGRILLLTEKLTRSELLLLYQCCDAFVLPSCGEGWGRPYMEAMACGKPVIGTLTGNGAFMTQSNAFLVPGKLVPVSPELAAEIPIYTGQRVVEADIDSLTDTLRQVASNSAEVTGRAAAGQQDILEKFNYTEVGKQLLSALDLPLPASVPATETPVLRIETAERKKPKIRIRFEGAVFS